jgi:sugar lactone lactonase YvrE
VRLDAGGDVRVLSERVVWPNGIGTAPDGGTVYVSDYARQIMLAVPADGGEARAFCRVPSGSPDGLALDAEGGVWVALGDAGAIARFHENGELDRLMPMPAGFVSSLCFGG